MFSHQGNAYQNTMKDFFVLTCTRICIAELFTKGPELETAQMSIN